MSNSSMPTEANRGTERKVKCLETPKAEFRKCYARAESPEVKADTKIYSRSAANQGFLAVIEAGSNIAVSEGGGIRSGTRQVVGTSGRDGVNRELAEKARCSALFSSAKEQCDTGDEAKNDEIDKEFDALVQKASQDLAPNFKEMGDCAVQLATTLEKLQQDYNGILANINSGLGFSPGNLETAFATALLDPNNITPNEAWSRTTDSGGTGYDSTLYLDWMGTEAANNFGSLSTPNPAGIPDYDPLTNMSTYNGPLGNGASESGLDSYPVGWATVLSFLFDRIEAINGPGFSEGDAQTIAAGPDSAQAKPALNKLFPAGTRSAGEDSTDTDGVQHGYSQSYQSDLYIHNIMRSGGAYGKVYNPADLEKGDIDSVQGGLTPTDAIRILNIAASKLVSSTNPVARQQGQWLQENLPTLESSLSTIKENAQCLFDNAQEIADKKNELDAARGEMADDKDLDMSDPYNAAAAQAAIGALEQEGLSADYFNKSKVIFKEQCWLLGYVDSIAEYKKSFLDNAVNKVEKSALKRLPYVKTDDKYTAEKSRPIGELDAANATLLVDGDPYGFLNQLVTAPSRQNLMDMTTQEISNLQPKIRLFKVEYDDEGNDAFEYEIPFDSHFTGIVGSSYTGTPINSFLKNGTRGTGVGIKSFNFVFDGTNPFAIKKSISANLKIFANSMNELLSQRTAFTGTGTPTIFRYTDLAMKTGKSIKRADAKYCADIDKENTTRSPLNFRLRAVVGWAKPKRFEGAGPLSQETWNALDDSYVTLNLTPTVHNFEIDDQGRVIFNINYLAYIDQFFDQSAFNIFANAEMNSQVFGGDHLVSLSRHARDLRIETLTSDCNQEDVKDRVEKDLDLLKNESLSSMSFLISSLIMRDKIYYVNLDYNKIRNYNIFGPYKDYETIAATIFDPGNPASSIVVNSQVQDEITAIRVADAMAAYDTAIKAKAGTEGEGGAEALDESKKRIRAALVGSDPNINTLSFFFLSDLVDIILENIDQELERLPKELNDKFVGDDQKSFRENFYVSEEQIFEKQAEFKRLQNNFKKMRILLGPAELFTRRSEQHLNDRLSVFVNLGDIPISVKFFLEFLTDKMLASSKVTYTLTKFLNDLLNNLTREFLNNDQCFKFSIKQKTRINQTVVSSYESSTRDNLTKLIPTEENGGGALRRFHRDQLPYPTLNIGGPTGEPVNNGGVANEYNYFVYFAARTQPTELMQGDKQSDKSIGIDHYLLGRDRGLIKNIKLNKTETKGLAEVRFETNGYQGLEQLRVVYDVEIDSYANVGTFPGTYIYVDPNGFAPKQDYDITKLGIGGYYMVIRSEHSFGPGLANSRIIAKWVHSIEAAAQADECAQRVDAGGNQTIRNRKCNYFKARKEASKQ